MNRGIVSAFVLSLTSYVLWAEGGYTNLAGNVISATPVKIEGAKVTFDCGAAGVRALPLRAFPASEQKRIREAVGGREVPGELKGLAAEIASQRARVEARTKAGRMTAEALAEYRANLAGSWAHAVETSNLNEAEKSYWKGNVP